MLYVKACCRVGEPLQALTGFLDPSMRVGLWSNATAWNYLMIKLDNAMIDPSEILGEKIEEGEEEEVEKKPAVMVAFEEMQRLGVKPNSQTYHVVIRALLLAGDKSGVEAMTARANAEGQLQQSTSSMASEGTESSDQGILSEDADLVDVDAFPAEALAK